MEIMLWGYHVNHLLKKIPQWRSNYLPRPPFETQNLKDGLLVLLSYIEGFPLIHLTLGVCQCYKLVNGNVQYNLNLAYKY